MAHKNHEVNQDLILKYRESFEKYNGLFIYLFAILARFNKLISESIIIILSLI